MHDDEHKHAEGDSGYEKRDVPSPLVFWSLTGLAIATVGSAIFVFGFFIYLRTQPDITKKPPSPFASERVLPPSPRLQANPPMDLEEYNAKMEKALNSYGWVDKSEGIAHIPVDVALDIVTDRGLPHGIENHVPKPMPETPQAGGQTTAAPGSEAETADTPQQQ